MAESDRIGAANLHGLARVERERRWVGIMDTLLALLVVAWVVEMTVVAEVPPVLTWAVPAGIGVVGLHRVLVSVERGRRERARRTVVVPRQLTRAGR